MYSLDGEGGRKRVIRNAKWFYITFMVRDGFYPWMFELGM
jgi:hypothetical protein